MKFAGWLATISIALAGCSTNPPPAEPGKVEPIVATGPLERGPAVVSDFDILLARNKSIAFRSWDGKLRGADSDLDFVFLPGNKLKMVEYGIGVFYFDGTYQVDANGNISAKLETPDPNWASLPPMILARDARSLVLQPAGPDHSEVGFASRGPFRAIAVTEQIPFPN